ncbi:WhiB family transcriptional regulator [Gordonia terrae]|uniref:WhiB family transcriptional regulator n=1 Tax=Gordonia terrae TaxID=2055 RepID=UPI003F6C78BA
MSTPVIPGDIHTAPLYPGRHRRAATQGPTWALVESPARHLPADAIPACARNPDAWFPDRLSTARDGLGHAEMAACRHCPIRQGCARVALDDTAHLTGIWAGIYISPPASASQKAVRVTAIEQLRAIAYPDQRPGHDGVRCGRSE